MRETIYKDRPVKYFPKNMTFGKFIYWFWISLVYIPLVQECDTESKDILRFWNCKAKLADLMVAY